MLLAEIADNARTGYTMGAILAVVCSWDRNKSVLLASLAGLCTWFYVVYFVITRR